MRDAHYADKVDMFFAHVGRNLDLRGAGLGDLIYRRIDCRRLHLGGARIRRLEGKVRKIRRLELCAMRRLAISMDAKEGAWPAKGQLRLDGFTFGRLGGFEGDSGTQTNKQK